MTTDTQEMPLNFSRDGDPLPTDTVDPEKLGRALFTLDGIVQRIRLVAEEALARAKALAMGSRDRGPDDYDTEDDDIRRLASIMERLVNRTNNYNNGDGDSGGSSRRLLAWILTVTSLLAVGGITGGVVMYGEVSSLKASVTQWQIANDRRMDQTERRLDRLENRSP